MNTRQKKGLLKIACAMWPQSSTIYIKTALDGAILLLTMFFLTWLANVLFVEDEQSIQLIEVGKLIKFHAIFLISLFYSIRRFSIRERASS